MIIKLKPYQQKALEELRQSDDPLCTLAGWEPGMGKSIVVATHIQELREALREMFDAFKDSIPSDTDKADTALDKARRILR